MNRVHGDMVNVFAAQKAVETSGELCRCIWMPKGRWRMSGKVSATFGYSELAGKSKGNNGKITSCF